MHYSNGLKVNRFMKTVVRVFQTSGRWHLQFTLERGSYIQVLRTFTAPKLIHVLDVANALQVHVDNIAELPISQYALQSTDNNSRWILAG